MTATTDNAPEALAPETLEYRTEVKQLLDILAHSLYTDREIFLRELISNASDALNRIQFEMLTNTDVLDSDAKLGIWIEVDAAAKTLALRDTGIGMNRDELIDNLGTIAHSGAKAFIQEAQEEKRSLEEIIGQFGVGFYSVFMVANEVAVTSRSYRPDDSAWTWRSHGDSSYSLEPADKESRGTEILIHLKDDALEFASAWRLEQIVKKHSDYVSFPIFVIDGAPVSDDQAGEQAAAETGATEAVTEAAPEPVNRQTAIWRQSPSSVQADEYDDFYKQLTFDFEKPLVHIHMVADMPVNMRSILYVPAKRERSGLNPRTDHGLRLYSRKVLIQEQNKELLPDYLRFVDGVVDSEDLPLNVSREMVQSNPVMRQLRKALTNRLLKEIKTLADKEPARYATFWTEFGVFLKEGIAVDPQSKDALVDLLRFHSSKTVGENGWTALQAYVENMAADQSEIYYVLGEDLKSVARSPHLDYFRANDIEVLYLVDPIDGFMISMLREYNEKTLRNIDDAGLDLPTREQDAATADTAETPLDDEHLAAVITRMKQALGAQVTDVRASKQLVDSPCRLVSPEDSFDRDLQRLRRMMEEDYEQPTKILEINRRHPLITNLSRLVAIEPDDKLIDATALQLFANAQLLDGVHPNPADMVERMQLLMTAALTGTGPAATAPAAAVADDTATDDTATDDTATDDTATDDTATENDA